MSLPTGLLEAKSILRAEVRRRLRPLGAEDWQRQAACVAERIAGLATWKSARWVGGYVPMAGELDLTPLLRSAVAAGKRVAVPAFDPVAGLYGFREICDWDLDLVPGRYGVREPGPACPPVPVTWLDFVLVPGLAFDGRGGRLGRGKGYYDRLLTPAVGVTCGVGVDEQLLPMVPMETHDISLNLVVLPSGLQGSLAMD